MLKELTKGIERKALKGNGCGAKKGTKKNKNTNLKVKLLAATVSFFNSPIRPVISERH